MQGVLSFLIVLVSALGAAATGFGFNLLSTPLLTFFHPPRTAVVLTLLLGVVVSGALLFDRGLRRAIDWTLVRPLCVGSLIGMPAGLLVLQHADGRVLKALVAAFTAVFAALMLFRMLPRRPPARRPLARLGVFAVGVVSGILSTSTSLNGPPVVLYLIARGLAKDRFRASMVGFVFIATVASVVLMAAGGVVPHATMTLALTFAPAVVVGLVAGSLLARRVAAQTFDGVVLAYLVLVGLLGLVTAIIGWRAAP